VKEAQSGKKNPMNTNQNRTMTTGLTGSEPQIAEKDQLVLPLTVDTKDQLFDRYSLTPREAIEKGFKLVKELHADEFQNAEFEIWPTASDPRTPLHVARSAPFGSWTTHAVVYKAEPMT